MDEANLTLYKLFFITSKREFCYLAPERFYSLEQGKPEGELEPSMDIFSLGCVLGEILLEGDVLFTHPQLLSFRKGEYSPDDVLAKLGPDLEAAQQLIKDMIQLDPSQRKTIDYYSDAWEAQVMPRSFPKLYALMTELVTEPTCKTTDQRLTWVRGNFKAIEQEFLDVEPSCALLFTNLFCSMVRNTSNPDSRIEVVEYLRVLIPKLTDEERMHRALPYLISLIGLNEERSIVKATCLDIIVGLLTSVNSFSSRDHAIFSEYIWPSLAPLAKDKSQFVRATFAKHLASLAEMTFLEINRRLLADQVKPLTVKSEPDARHLYESMAFEVENAPIVLSGSPNLKESYEVEAHNLRVMFAVSLQMMHTETPSVQKLLIKSLPRLCKLFERKFTTKFILPMILPYFSKSGDSKLMLLKGLPELIDVIGVTAFEYISPYILSLFKDPDEIVLEYSVKALAKAEALPPLILLNYVVHLLDCLVHPNYGIRSQVIAVLRRIVQGLDSADNYCQLRPLLIPYLTAPGVIKITADVLEQHLVKPVRRQVFDAFLQQTEPPELLPHEASAKDIILRFFSTRTKLPTYIKKDLQGQFEEKPKSENKKNLAKSDLRQSIINSYENFCPTGKTLCCLTEHKSPVTALTVSSDSSIFASSSKDGAVKVWRVERIESFRALNSSLTLKLGNKPVRNILFYKDDRHLAVAHEDPQTRIALYDVFDN